MSTQKAASTLSGPSGPASPVTVASTAGAGASFTSVGTGGTAQQHAAAAAAAAALENDPAIRNSRIVASTFANLELVSARNTLAQYQQMYQEAQRVNAELAENLKDRDRDSVQVIEFLRVEVEAKAAAIMQLENQLGSIEGKKNAEMEAKSGEFALQLRAKDDVIASLRETVATLSKELDNVAEFRRQQVELNISLQQARDEKQRLVQDYERELSRVKFAALEEKVKLRAVEQAMSGQFEAEVHAKAMQLVDAKAKQIHAENQALQKDKAVLDKEVQRLIPRASAS
jgi:hypothetical protein